MCNVKHTHKLCKPKGFPAPPVSSKAVIWHRNLPTLPLQHMAHTEQVPRVCSTTTQAWQPAALARFVCCPPFGALSACLPQGPDCPPHSPTSSLSHKLPRPSCFPRRTCLPPSQDYHTFNTLFRDGPLQSVTVVGFTHAQIPHIESSRYPACLAGPKYPGDQEPLSKWWGPLKQLWLQFRVWSKSNVHARRASCPACRVDAISHPYTRVSGR